MNKKHRLILTIGLCSIFTLSSVSNSANLKANEATNQKVLEVKEEIKNISTITNLTSAHKDYVYSVLYMYNNLTSSQKQQIDSNYVRILNAAYATISNINEADNFSKEFDYLLNSPTFTYQNKLNELTTKYNSLSENVKKYISNYTQDNISTIESNANLLKPDIYYDFTNASVSNNTILNQGTLENKNATMIGNVSLSNSGMKFTSNSSSCLKLPEDMFANTTDFTLSFIFTKEVSDNLTETIYSIGNSEYYSNSAGKMGLRSYYAEWAKRGPFHQIAHLDVTTSSKEIGTCPQLVPQGNDLHTYKMTIRYLSKPQHIQVYEEDLTTNMFYSFNYTGHPSSPDISNPANVLNSSNFNFNQFNENYLGAKNGSSNGAYSFKGRYLSFRYYSKLVSDREMYGSDDRILNVGQQETLDYINNFEKVGASFLTYKDEYAPVIDKYYYQMITCPYDYQKLFDSTHVAYFMEAYNLIHS